MSSHQKAKKKKKNHNRKTTNSSTIWHNSNNWEWKQQTKYYTHEIIKGDDISGMLVTSQVKISWPSICCLISILFDLLLDSLSPEGGGGVGEKLREIMNWVLRRIYGRRHVRGSNRKTNPILFFKFFIIYRLNLEYVLWNDLLFYFLTVFH
jgi:hypothetical protein